MVNNRKGPAAMLKKITVFAVVLATSFTLSARGHRGGAPAMRPSGGSVSRQPGYRPVSVPQSSYRPPPARPPQSVRPVQPPGVRPDHRPGPRPPHRPHHPGHRPPPPPPPRYPYWDGYYYSSFIPTVPAVYYGDIPSDYTYAWYNDKYVIYWRGWFWYNNVWVWGGQGTPPAPPNWRPR